MNIIIYTNIVKVIARTNGQLFILTKLFKITTLNDLKYYCIAFELH